MLKSPNISMLSNFYNCFLSVSGASLIICFQNFQNPEKLTIGKKLNCLSLYFLSCWENVTHGERNFIELWVESCNAV